METGRITAEARRLREALSRQGAALEPSALEAVVRSWTGLEPQNPPLSELDAALRQHGITLEAEALAQVAWAMLGVPSARSVRLAAGARGRLTHLAELHDLTSPSGARALARQLAGEVHLAPDLLRARPWLAVGLTGAAPQKPETQKPEDVLGAVFETEWSGFLVLLGEFGPWVYVPSIADLQALSHRYAALVEAASGSRDAEVLAAAHRLQQAGPGGSLLARLEASDYRPRRDGSSGAAPGASVLVALEQAFWESAEQQARQRHAEWTARRTGPGRRPPH